MTSTTNEIEKESPLLEMINKRLRAQKKRLTKIEKYELLDKSQLNADQIETISRKSEVNGNIKELEGILEQILAFEKLSIEKEKETEQKIEEEKRKLIVEAVEKEKDHQTGYQNYVQKLTFTLNISLSSLVGAHSITEDEFTALVSMKQRLVGPFNEDFEMQDFISDSSKIMWNLYEKSDELVVNSTLTYGQIFDLIERLLSPQPEPRFGMFEMSRAAENAKSAAVGGSSSPAVVMPSFPSSINFLNPAVVSSITSSGPKKTQRTNVSNSESPASTKEKIQPSEKSKKKRFRRPKIKAASVDATPAK